MAHGLKLMLQLHLVQTYTNSRQMLNIMVDVTGTLINALVHRQVTFSIVHCLTLRL